MDPQSQSIIGLVDRLLTHHSQSISSLFIQGHHDLASAYSELATHLDHELESYIHELYEISTSNVNLLMTTAPFYGASLLMVCCQYQCYRCVKLLLEYNADVEVCHMLNNTITAVYFALTPFYGHYTNITYDIIELLLIYKAYPRSYHSIGYMLGYLASGHSYLPFSLPPPLHSSQPPSPPPSPSPPRVEHRSQVEDIHVRIVQLLLSYDYPTNLNLLEYRGVFVHFFRLFSIACDWHTSTMRHIHWANTSSSVCQRGVTPQPTKDVPLVLDNDASPSSSSGNTIAENDRVHLFLSHPHAAPYLSLFDLLRSSAMAYYGLYPDTCHPSIKMYFTLLTLTRSQTIHLAFIRHQMITIFNIHPSQLQPYNHYHNNHNQGQSQQGVAEGSPYHSPSHPPASSLAHTLLPYFHDVLSVLRSTQPYLHLALLHPSLNPLELIHGLMVTTLVRDAVWYQAVSLIVALYFSSSTSSAPTPNSSNSNPPPIPSSRGVPPTLQQHSPSPRPYDILTTLYGFHRSARPFTHLFPFQHFVVSSDTSVSVMPFRHPSTLLKNSSTTTTGALPSVPSNPNSLKYLEHIQTLATHFDNNPYRPPSSMPSFALPSTWQVFHNHFAPSLLLYQVFHPRPYASRCYLPPGMKIVKQHRAALTILTQHDAVPSGSKPHHNAQPSSQTCIQPTTAHRQQYSYPYELLQPSHTHQYPHSTHFTLFASETSPSDALMGILAGHRPPMVTLTTIDQSIKSKIVLPSDLRHSLSHIYRLYPPPSKLPHGAIPLSPSFNLACVHDDSHKDSPSQVHSVGLPVPSSSFPSSSLPPPHPSPSRHPLPYSILPPFGHQSEISLFNLCQFLLDSRMFSLFEFILFDPNLPYISHDTMVFLLTCSKEYLDYYSTVVSHTMLTQGQLREIVSSEVFHHISRMAVSPSSTMDMHRRYTLTLLIHRFKLLRSPDHIDQVILHFFLPVFNVVHQTYLSVLDHANQRRGRTQHQSSSLTNAIQTEASSFLQLLYHDDTIPVLWCYRLLPYLNHVSFFHGHIPVISSRSNWVGSLLFVQKLYLLFYLRFKHLVDSHMASEHVDFRSFSQSPTWKFRHRSGLRVIDLFLQYANLHSPATHQFYHLFVDYIIPHCALPTVRSPEVRCLLDPRSIGELFGEHSTPLPSSPRSPSHLGLIISQFSRSSSSSKNTPPIVDKMFNTRYFQDKTHDDCVQMLSQIISSRSPLPQPNPASHLHDLISTMIPSPSPPPPSPHSHQPASSHSRAPQQTSPSSSLDDVVIMRGYSDYTASTTRRRGRGGGGGAQSHQSIAHTPLQSYLPTGTIYIINKADYHGQSLQYSLTPYVPPASVNTPFQLQFLSSFSVYLIHTTLYRIYKTSPFAWIRTPPPPPLAQTVPGHRDPIPPTNNHSSPSSPSSSSFFSSWPFSSLSSPLESRPSTTTTTTASTQSTSNSSHNLSSIDAYRSMLQHQQGKLPKEVTRFYNEKPSSENYSKLSTESCIRQEIMDMTQLLDDTNLRHLHSSSKRGLHYHAIPYLGSCPAYIYIPNYLHYYHHAFQKHQAQHHHGYTLPATPFTPLDGINSGFKELLGVTLFSHPHSRFNTFYNHDLFRLYAVDGDLFVPSSHQPQSLLHTGPSSQPLNTPLPDDDSVDSSRAQLVYERRIQRINHVTTLLHQLYGYVRQPTSLSDASLHTSYATHSDTSTQKQCHSDHTALNQPSPSLPQHPPNPSLSSLTQFDYGFSAFYKKLTHGSRDEQDPLPNDAADDLPPLLPIDLSDHEIEQRYAQMQELLRTMERTGILPPKRYAAASMHLSPEERTLNHIRQEMSYQQTTQVINDHTIFLSPNHNLPAHHPISPCSIAPSLSSTYDNRNSNNSNNNSNHHHHQKQQQQQQQQQQQASSLPYSSIHEAFGIPPLHLQEHQRFYLTQLIHLFNIYVVDLFSFHHSAHNGSQQRSSPPPPQPSSSSSPSSSQDGGIPPNHHHDHHGHHNHNDHHDHISHLFPSSHVSIPVKFTIDITPYLTTTCEVNGNLLSILNGMQLYYHQYDPFNPLLVSHPHRTAITDSPQHMQHALYSLMIAQPQCYDDLHHFTTGGRLLAPGLMSLSHHSSPSLTDPTHRFDLFNFNVIDVVLHVQSHFHDSITLKIYDNETQHIWHLILLTFISTLHPFLPLTHRDVALVRFLIEKVNHDRETHKSTLNVEKYYRYYHSGYDKTILSRRLFKLPVNAHSVEVVSMLYQHNIISPLEQNLHMALVASQSSARHCTTLAPPVLRHYLRSLFLSPPSDDSYCHDDDMVIYDPHNSTRGYEFNYDPEQGHEELPLGLHDDLDDDDSDYLFDDDDDDDDGGNLVYYHQKLNHQQQNVASILSSAHNSFQRLPYDLHFHYSLLSTFTLNIPLQQPHLDMLIVLTSAVQRAVKREMNILHINVDVDPYTSSFASIGITSDLLSESGAPLTASSLLSCSSRNLPSSVLLQLTELSRLFETILHGRPMLSIGPVSGGSGHGIASKPYYQFLSFFIRELCFSLSAKQFLAFFSLLHNHFHYTTSWFAELILTIWGKLSLPPSLPQYFDPTQTRTLVVESDSPIGSEMAQTISMSPIDDLRNENPPIYSMVCDPLIRAGARMNRATHIVLLRLLALGFNVHHFPSRQVDPDIWRGLLLRPADGANDNHSILTHQQHLQHDQHAKYLDIYLIQDYFHDHLTHFSLRCEMTAGDFFPRVHHLWLKVSRHNGKGSGLHKQSTQHPQPFFLSSHVAEHHMTVIDKTHAAEGRVLSTMLFYNIFNTPYFISKELHLDTTQSAPPTAIALSTLPLSYAYSTPVMAFLHHPSNLVRNEIFSRYREHQNPLFLASIRSWFDFTMMRIALLDSYNMGSDPSMYSSRGKAMDTYEERYNPTNEASIEMDQLEFHEEHFSPRLHPFNLDLLSLQTLVTEEFYANPSYYTSRGVHHPSLMVYILDNVYNPSSDDIMTLFLGCYNDDGDQICSPILSVPSYREFQKIDSSSAIFSVIDKMIRKSHHNGDDDDDAPDDDDVTPLLSSPSILTLQRQQRDQLIIMASIIQIFTLALLRRWDSTILLFLLNMIGIDNIVHFFYNYQLYYQYKHHTDRSTAAPVGASTDSTTSSDTTVHHSNDNNGNGDDNGNDDDDDDEYLHDQNMPWRWSLLEFLRSCHTEEHAPEIVAMIKTELEKYSPK